MRNRQWLLARRPEGAISPADFAYREVEMGSPDLAPGEVLVRSRLFRFVPAARTWMKAGSQFVPPMPLGEPVMGSSAAEVIASAHPGYPVGTVLSAMTGWQDYAVIAPDLLPVPPRRRPEGVSLLDFEGLLGGNSLTGYVGMTCVAQVRAGETVVVSAAAGSTGSIAAQVAKNLGCTVIGIAGGADKCRWLTEECRLDGAIDYKAEDVGQRLAHLCPEGINVFFDNVGGAMLDAAIAAMAPHGRVALCGQISSYDEGNALAPGPRDMMRVIYWRLKLLGFLSFDYPESVPQAEADLLRWAAAGILAHREEVVAGFELLPKTFARLFDSSHIGTLLLEP